MRLRASSRPSVSLRRFAYAGWLRPHQGGAWVLGVALIVVLLPRVAWAAPMSEAAFRQILLLLSVVSVGYIVTHLAIERLSQRFVLGRDIEAILLGVVLGPFLGIIDPELSHDIRPILSLGAGALGMLVGLELGETADQRVRGAWFAGTMVTLCTIACLTALPLAAMAIAGLDLTDPEAWTISVVASAVVVLGSDGTVVRSIADRMGAQGLALARGIAVAQRTQAIAVIGFGVFFAVVHPSIDIAFRAPLDAARAFAFQIGIGLVLGFLARIIIHRALEERVLLMVLVGLVFLAGGLAYALQVSAIFVNFVSGIVIRQTCQFAPEITRMMDNIKRPFVIALYFFAGLEWIAGPVWLFAMVPVLIILRRTGRRIGGWLGTRVFSPSLHLSAATLAPGGLAVAFMLTLRIAYQGVPGIRETYGPLLVAVVVMELTAPRVVRRWLLDVADVPPVTPSPVADVRV